MCLVARTRFELVISALRGRRPKPLDERAIQLSGTLGWDGENRTPTDGTRIRCPTVRRRPTRCCLCAVARESNIRDWRWVRKRYLGKTCLAVSVRRSVNLVWPPQLRKHLSSCCGGIVGSSVRLLHNIWMCQGRRRLCFSISLQSCMDACAFDVRPRGRGRSGQSGGLSW